MSHIVKVETTNKNQIFEIDKVARQASGSVLLREGDAVILAAVSYDAQRVEEDFLPLTVQYVEKSYAVSKIPGGYIKRESRPSDFETLTSRIIDRSLRPLFPSGYRYPTQITVMVLSADDKVDLQTMAINAASAALFLSELPVNKSVASIRVAKIDQTLILNPTNSELSNSTLDLFVSGVEDDLLMIEMRVRSSEDGGEFRVNELSNDEMIEALSFANSAIKEASMSYKEALTPYQKSSGDFVLDDIDIDQTILKYIKANKIDLIYDAINKMAKSERAGELKAIAKVIESEHSEWESSKIESAISLVKKEVVREQILSEGKRADGRGLRDVRDIEIETNILPSVHSSCLFTRGQTQALVALTLGDSKDAQSYDLLTSKETLYENFMVHYNFPGFSVGEASMLKAPGRRELGHGNLAKRALMPSFKLPKSETIRLVSEILESNGSSSMATVCGGSLALKAAGVKVEKLIAGVAMGLVVEDDRYAILTDIMGLEDHDGDMDFKIAGSREGITALQMDIKLGGISKEILKEAIDQASKAKDHILSIMEDASKKIVLNSNALPSINSFDLDSKTFGAIIGQGGKNIKEITQKYGVKIDLDRSSGIVKVEGDDDKSVEDATQYIKELAAKGSFKKEMPTFKEGQVFDGIVRRIVDFGAFVELPGGVDGLLHISKLSDERVENVTDILSIDEKIKVKILAQNGNKIELSFIEKV